MNEDLMILEDEFRANLKDRSREEALFKLISKARTTEDLMEIYNSNLDIIEVKDD